QGAPHLGHLRTFVAFDVLVRWLERSGLEVTHVRNVTDIDDKILTRSAEAGAPWWAWSLRFEREFQDVLDRIGNRRPSYEPRATAPVRRGHAGRRGGDGARQARPSRFRAVEGGQGDRAGQRLLGHPLRAGATGLASRVLRHEPQVPGRDLRHPRRRPRPALP